MLKRLHEQGTNAMDALQFEVLRPTADATQAVVVSENQGQQAPRSADGPSSVAALLVGLPEPARPTPSSKHGYSPYEACPAKRVVAEAGANASRAVDLWCGGR